MLDALLWVSRAQCARTGVDKSVGRKAQLLLPHSLASLVSRSIGRAPLARLRFSPLATAPASRKQNAGHQAPGQKWHTKKLLCSTP